MRELEIKLRRGMTDNGIRASGARGNCPVHRVFRAVWISGIARGQFCSDCLCECLSQVLLSRSVYSGHAQQPAHGFYSASTLVKDAQLHGLRVKPIDVLHSDWFCTLEPEANQEPEVQGKQRFAMRLGLLYARGLRKEAGEALVRARKIQAFDSIHNLALRVPELRKSDLTMLARVGALNSLGEGTHRR